MPSSLFKVTLALSGSVILGQVTAALAAPAVSVPNVSVPAGAPSVQEAAYKALAGAWVGALEYRDYSSNGRVTLPTILHIRMAKDAKSLTLHYIYDDGPTKVVEDFETVTIDPVANTYTTVSGDGKDTSTDTLAGPAKFASLGQGPLVRMGKGQENGKPVAVRTTLTITPRTLTILKETQAPGQPFLFRDQHTLTRVVPATTGH